MKNNYLLSGDNGVTGIYRCKLIYDNDTNDIKVYVPGISSIHPYNPDGTLNLEKYNEHKDAFPKVQWCCYNIESKQLENQDSLNWCMFENGDFKRPVVISYAVIGGSSINGGSSTVSQDSTTNNKPSNKSPSTSNPDTVIDDGTGTWELIGNDFKITHYCACKDCCGKSPSHPAYGITASGTTVEEGRTIAVDPSIIPLGSTVKIIGGKVDPNGHVYIAEDTGGAIKGHRIDIYISDHQRAQVLGVAEPVTVYVLK